ncbi:TonB-dependent receptor [Sphingomonas sp. UYP23]
MSADSQTLNGTGLGDIIVTAQRQSESSQRAAIAINVVSGADLVNNGITQPDRLNSLVPALTIANVGPSATSFIRGVGNFSVQITSDPAVAFNYDGIYIGRLTATSTTFFDTDRVEVLKGPQGTLYGRNATAGAINILPTQPKIGEFSGYGSIQYGNYNAFSTEGAVNLPIGENGAIRISGIVNNRDGYNRDGSSDDKSQGLRIQLKSHLTPDLTARLAFDYEHLGGLGTGLSFLDTYACSAATANTPGQSPHCVVTPTGLSRAEGNTSAASQAFWTSLFSGVAGRHRDPFPANYQDSNFFGSNADIEWNTRHGTLTIIPAVRFDHVQNTNPSGGFPIANDQKDIQYSVETRFAGKVSLFDYTLGFFYYNENARLRQGSITSNSSGSFAEPTVVNTQSYAPFARVTAHLGPKLRLVGGIRYTRDNKQFNSHNITIAETCAAGATCPTAILPTPVPYETLLPFAIPGQSPSQLTPVTVPGPTPNSIISRTDYFFNNSLSVGRVTWRAAAEFDLTSTSLLYASAETGFRSGGFNTAVVLDANAPISQVYQPEYITAYTLGSKNRFLNNRVQLNVEAFLWKYRNEQVAHGTVDEINRPGSYTQNVGSSTIKGVEVEARVLVTPTTQLGADVQYLHARNDDFTFNVVGYPSTNCAVASAGFAGRFPLFSVNCSGLPSYNSPTWSANFSAQQTVPIGDYKLVLTADTQYKTSRFAYFDYATEQLQKASWTTNAQVSFGPANGRWSFAGFVRNIENTRLLSAPIAFQGLLSAYTTPPRTYGARLSHKF